MRKNNKKNSQFFNNNIKVYLSLYTSIASCLLDKVDVEQSKHTNKTQVVIITITILLL